MINQSREKKLAANIRSDADLHREATDKVRNKLFEKYSAQALSIILVTERLIPMTRSEEFGTRFGGLEYAVVHSRFTRILVAHDRAIRFTVILFQMYGGLDACGIKQEMVFEDLSWRIILLLA